ncbi:DUF1453 family protein [Streptomyces sp. J2-1]|uniref:DUF1453 family protein n=1 Tax=Streptomyces corallincola TaxID=2851888 RepID=UPI001C3946A1|nr:DUF1453 family protein [Streptomyces corallincola]MBV2357021.1 DUF1453 family protein [Streptomyces corallincola]
MSGLVNALVIVAVVVLVVVRQFRARPVTNDRRWWLLPLILGFVALRGGGLVDPHHHTASVALIAAELVVALATGAGWAWTSRMWTEADGVVWTRSGRTSAFVWIGGIVLRVGLYALGALAGVHQDSGALILGLACTLLVRAGVLALRAQSTGSAANRVPAYGDGMRAVRKGESV